MKKVLAIIIAVCVFSTFFTACKRDVDELPQGQAGENAAVVRFLNFTAEVAWVYDEIAKAYK